MKKLIVTEFILLLAGTLFAWTNLGIEMVDWLNARTCSTGCVVGIVNPFYTPCFYGAIMFTITFIISAVIYKKTK